MGWQNIPKKSIAQFASAFSKGFDQKWKSNDLKCPICGNHCWDTEPNITHGVGNDAFKRIGCKTCKTKGKYYPYSEMQIWDSTA